MSPDVITFARGCIQCLSTLRREKVPHPYGPDVFGTKRTVVPQLDYVDIGPGKHGEKYMSICFDYHSSYNFLFAFANTVCTTAAQAIIDWQAAFGVPSDLMSDGLNHF